MRNSFGTETCTHICEFCSEFDDCKAVWGDVDETAHILQKILLICFLSQVSYLVKHPYLGIKPHGNNHNDVLHHNHPQQFFVVHSIK